MPVFLETTRIRFYLRKIMDGGFEVSFAEGVALWLFCRILLFFVWGWLLSLGCGLCFGFGACSLFFFMGLGP